MADLILHAAVEGGSSIDSNGDGTPSLAVAVGDTVTWSVTVPEGVTLETLRLLHEQQQITIAPADGEYTLDLPFDADGVGEYHAIGKPAGSLDVLRSDPITLTREQQAAAPDDASQKEDSDADKDEDDDEETPQRVLETEIGEYDPEFASLVGALAMVLIAVIIVGAGIAMVSLGIASVPATLPDGEVANGTWNQRALALLLFFMMAVGAAILVVGAALAALETRGRLREKEAAAPTRAGVPLGDVSKIVESMRTMRGSIAVIAAGLVIIVFAGGFALGLTSGGGAPDPEPSTSGSAEG